MAKSLEDTASYRVHRLLALNEVGGNSAAGGLSVASFHERMKERAAILPHGLTATATHDTKRARTRARYALSELPDEWTQSVHEWRPLNAKFIASSGLPAGEVYAAVEAPKGEFGVYLISDGTNRPYKARSGRPNSPIYRRWTS